MDAHPILTVLLASPGGRWGPVINSVTVLDVLLLLLVGAAAVRGWYLGISRVALWVGGLVAGLLAGLWAAVHLVPASLSPGVTLALEVGFVIAGALIGSRIGAAIGARAARLLAAVHLRLPDRAAGAIGRGALALVITWLLVAGAAALPPGQAAAAARTMTARSVLLSVTSQAVPVDQLRQRVVADVPVPADRGDAHGRRRLTVVTGSPEYVRAAQVRPGKSGGPLLSADGHVIGVVDACSVTDPDTGYAIASPQPAPVVAAAATATSPVGTGSCAAPAAAG